MQIAFIDSGNVKFLKLRMRMNEGTIAAPTT